MNKFVVRQSLILLLTAIIWGVAFVAQSVGTDYVGPFTFIAVRNVIGVIVLLPVVYIIDKKKSHEDLHEEVGKEDKRALLTGGITCGTLLFIASAFQQVGIKYTSVGKAGYITAMYIVLVPIIGMFMHKKTGVKIWIGVMLAVIGMYFLCIAQGDSGMQMGDILIFICAFTFSFHILTVDHFSPKVDGVKMSCIQFVTCGILSAIFMLIFENPNISDILDAWIPILYAGAMSSGVAYTLQIVGQKGMNPAVASLILSLESVVSVLAGWIILHQNLSAREIFGCCVAFAAIIIVQLPDNLIIRKKNKSA
jgi:drug/metabolite transporter (DMT)-like permease